LKKPRTITKGRQISTLKFREKTSEAETLKLKKTSWGGDYLGVGGGGIRIRKLHIEGAKIRPSEGETSC